MKQNFNEGPGKSKRIWKGGILGIYRLPSTKYF